MDTGAEEVAKDGEAANDVAAEPTKEGGEEKPAAAEKAAASETVLVAEVSSDKPTEAVALKEDGSGEKVKPAEDKKETEPEKSVESDTLKGAEAAAAADDEVVKSEQNNAEPEKEEDTVPASGSLSFALLEREQTKNALRTSRTIVVLRGLPGSGKSFLARAIADAYKDHCSVICADDHGVKPESPESSADGYKALDELVIVSKVEALQMEISELAKRLRYEVSVRARERGWTDKQSRFHFQKNLRHLVSQLYIRDNCHPFKASLLVWVQLPLWISLSLALRNLSLDQSALQCDLAAGGALWFPDLTLPDSTWILPVCLGLINLLIVEVFSLQRVSPTRFQKLVLNFIRGFSVLMIPIAATVPSSMALYWFTSSLLGFSHNLLLRSPAIHKILKLQTARSDSPYRDLLSAFISKYYK